PAATTAERREVLEFVRQELLRQVVFGDGLLWFQETAQGVLGADELLATLHEGWAARPDLWHAWSALVQQLTRVRQLDEALERGREAVRRFPLLPRLWLDLAGVCRARGDAAGAREALDKALQINPGWSPALRELAEVHDEAGRLDEARVVLEQAVAREPLDAANHGCLAYTLWRLGRHDEAVEAVQRAVRCDPGYDWGWDALRDWTRKLGRPRLAAECARELTERRPGAGRSRLVRAKGPRQPGPPGPRRGPR